MLQSKLLTLSLSRSKDGSSRGDGGTFEQGPLLHKLNILSQLKVYVATFLCREWYPSSAGDIHFPSISSLLWCRRNDKHSIVHKLIFRILTSTCFVSSFICRGKFDYVILCTKASFILRYVYIFCNYSLFIITGYFSYWHVG